MNHLGIDRGSVRSLVDKAAKAFLAAGILFAILFGLLLLYVLWRLIRHCMSRRSKASDTGRYDRYNTAGGKPGFFSRFGRGGKDTTITESKTSAPVGSSSTSSDHGNRAVQIDV